MDLRRWKAFAIAGMLTLSWVAGGGVAHADPVPGSPSAGAGVDAEAGKTLGQLRGLRGRGFDAAYTAAQVAVHERSLALMDDVLLPTVRSARLRGMIEQNRAHAAARLQQARTLAAALPGVPPVARRTPTQPSR